MDYGEYFRRAVAADAGVEGSEQFGNSYPVPEFYRLYGNIYT